MNLAEIRKAVIEALCQVAPEADPAQLRADVSFRQQLDIDSMDFLRFMIALHERTQCDIPEKDYPKLITLDGCIAYLNAAAPTAPQRKH